MVIMRFDLIEARKKEETYRLLKKEPKQSINDAEI